MKNNAKDSKEKIFSFIASKVKSGTDTLWYRDIASATGLSVSSVSKYVNKLYREKRLDIYIKAYKGYRTGRIPYSYKV